MASIQRYTATENGGSTKPSGSVAIDKPFLHEFPLKPSKVLAVTTASCGSEIDKLLCLVCYREIVHKITQTAIYIRRFCIHT